MQGDRHRLRTQWGISDSEAPRIRESPSVGVLACAHLRLDELIHSAITPHAKVCLHELGGSFKQAVALALRQHAPPSLNGNGRDPKAAAILSHATINSDIARDDGFGCIEGWSYAVIIATFV